MKKVLLLIALLLMLPINNNAAEKKVLVVSLHADGFFDDEPEKRVVDAFLQAYPDYSIHFITQYTAALPKTADVYLAYTAYQDIRSLLNEERFAALDDLISDDTRQNVIALDKLLNSNGDLAALPLYYKVYMMTLGNEFESRINLAEYMYPNRADLETWGALYNWAKDYPFNGEGIDLDIDFYLASGIPLIAWQINLMAEDINTGEINFDTSSIRTLLDEWRTLIQNTSVYLHEPFGLEDIRFPADALCLVANCRFVTWCMNTGVLPTYMPLPYANVNNSSPVSALVAFVDDHSTHKEAAVAFIECWYHPDIEKLIPTEGKVRKDLMDLLRESEKNNENWFIEVKDFYGELIDEQSYDNYLYALEHSRIAYGSHKDVLQSTQVLMRYFMDELTMDDTLKELDVIMKDVCEGNP